MKTMTSNNSQTPYQLAPPPSVGLIPVTTLSYVFLGLGAVLPVLLLTSVALFLRCYKVKREKKEAKWDYLAPNHVSLDDKDAWKIVQSNKAVGLERYRSLSDYSVKDPYLAHLAITDSGRGSQRNTGIPRQGAAPVFWAADIKRSETNVNVYFRSDPKEDSVSRTEEADSVITDSEPGLSSSASDASGPASMTEYRYHGIKSVESELIRYKEKAEAEKRKRRRTAKESDNQHGIIMGVHRLVDKHATLDRTKTHKLPPVSPSKRTVTSINTHLARIPSSPAGAAAGRTAGTAAGAAAGTAAVASVAAAAASVAARKASVKGADQSKQSETGLGVEEEKVLRYFDEMYHELGIDLDATQSDAEFAGFGPDRYPPNVGTSYLLSSSLQITRPGSPYMIVTRL